MSIMIEPNRCGNNFQKKLRQNNLIVLSWIKRNINISVAMFLKIISLYTSFMPSYSCEASEILLSSILFCLLMKSVVPNFLAFLNTTKTKIKMHLLM